MARAPDRSARTLAVGLLAVAACAAVLYAWRGDDPTATHDARRGPDAATAIVRGTPATPDAGPALAKQVAMPPAPEGDAGTSRACDALAAANEARMAAAEDAQARDGGPRCPAKRPDVGCVTTSAGVTWGYRVARARVRYEGQDMEPDASDFHCETEVAVDLVREDDAGLRVLPDAGEVLEYAWHVHRREVSLRALVDYDGDGEIEILRAREGSFHEGGRLHALTLLTFRQGRLAVYPPAAGLDIESVEDVDGDGRPDLVTRGPYGNVTTDDAMGNSWNVGPAIFAQHARSDGTFALGDRESVAYTRRRCPARPAPATLELEDTESVPDEALVAKMVCGRLWGAPSADIVQAWDAVCARDAGADAEPRPYACRTWPKELAAVSPPFRLK